MEEYERLGHMTQVDGSMHNLKRSCHLPHHDVWKETSTFTKLRVVFNGSATIPSGDSLNGSLFTGPNLLPALVDVMLRWRKHRCVIAADIKKMYRQIMVHPDDRNWQQIVWRSNSEGPVYVYQLNTVTYGLACAPFLAIWTLRQLADDEVGRFPVASLTLK